MIHPDHHHFQPEPSKRARLHPVEFILLATVAIGLLAFLCLVWRAL